MQNGNVNSGVISIRELTANLGGSQQERQKTEEEIEREEIIQKLAIEAQEAGVVIGVSQLRESMVQSPSIEIKNQKPFVPDRRFRNRNRRPHRLV